MTERAVVQLSSPFLTALHRRYLPVIIGLALWIMSSWIMFLEVSDVAKMVWVLVAVVIAGTYYSVYFTYIRSVADQVTLAGEELRVRRKKVAYAISVSCVKSVRLMASANPVVIGIELEKSGWKWLVLFIPYSDWRHAVQQHPVLKGLCQDAAG